MMSEDFLKYLKEYDKYSPLVSSLKILYKLGLISASDLMNFAQTFEIPMEVITETVRIFDEEFIEPLFIVSFVKYHKSLMEQTNGKVYDGRIYPVTIITPAQFLNLLAKLKLPPAFSVYQYKLNSVANYCIKVALKHNVVYQIYDRGFVDLGFVLNKLYDMSSYLKFFISNQLRVVKTPLERRLLEEKLKEYENADESQWYKYPFIKTNVDVDPQVAVEIAKKVLLPVQVVKKIIQLSNSKYVSEIRQQFGLSEEQVEKIINLYKQMRGDSND